MCQFISQILKKIFLASGKRAKSFIQRGELVPDDLVGEIIVTHLEEQKHKNILLDGKNRRKRKRIRNFLFGICIFKDFLEL